MPIHSPQLAPSQCSAHLWELQLRADHNTVLYCESYNRDHLLIPSAFMQTAESQLENWLPKESEGKGLSGVVGTLCVSC